MHGIRQKGLGKAEQRHFSSPPYTLRLPKFIAATVLLNSASFPIVSTDVGQTIPQTYKQDKICSDEIGTQKRVN